MLLEASVLWVHQGSASGGVAASAGGWGASASAAVAASADGGVQGASAGLGGEDMAEVWTGPAGKWWVSLSGLPGGVSVPEGASAGILTSNGGAARGHSLVEPDNFGGFGVEAESHFADDGLGKSAGTEGERRPEGACIHAGSSVGPGGDRGPGQAGIPAGALALWVGGIAADVFAAVPGMPTPGLGPAWEGLVDASSGGMPPSVGSFLRLQVGQGVVVWGCNSGYGSDRCPL